MPRFITLSIRRLPLGTTAQDVRKHILNCVPDSNPIVGPLVREAHKPKLHTTVTLQQDTDAACNEAFRMLHASEIFPQKPDKPFDTSSLAVSRDFVGVTTVAEHEDPQFE